MLIQVSTQLAPLSSLILPQTVDLVGVSTLAAAIASIGRYRPLSVRVFDAGYLVSESSTRTLFAIRSLINDCVLIPCGDRLVVASEFFALIQVTEEAE